MSTVGVNEATIVKYVREQEERDKITDQYSLGERPISFTSRKKHEVGMSRDRAILKGDRVSVPYRAKLNRPLKGRF